MTRDEMLLERAVSALRAADGGDDDGHGEGVVRTRARVVRRVRIRRVVRHAAVVLVALAFVFVGVPSAWALVTGRPPAWVEPILRAFSPAPSETAAAAPTRSERAPARRGTAVVREAPAPIAAPIVAPSVAPVAPVAVEAVHVAEAVAVRAPAVGAHANRHEVEAAPAPAPASASAPEPTAVAPTVTPEELDALYRAAHELHFVARDAEAALAAWDRYLAAAPTGRFAPEARYNRALDLVRLGRVDAAREALGPIARGERGDYRQQEAAALLSALDAPRPTPAP